MKNKIAKMKQHLENVYNNRSILNKEEQLRALKEELRLLEDEKSGLLKIKREQAKSLQQLQSEE